MSRVWREAAVADRAVYEAIAITEMPTLDAPIRRLSNAANRSALWLGAAVALGLFGGARGRRAAVRGVIAVGLTSALVNQGLKRLAERERPDRAGARVPRDRFVVMPTSSSFPSGHSASGFAFAAAVGRVIPALAMPLECAAGAVAYSRIHTGVHYPGDTIIGALVGTVLGRVVSGMMDRFPR